eukprot:CAMPEP_0181087090 /NCGR_PEP_ID=MMETSP1071-20121207/6091_1 /TAXON_ID=35127 /ORGANISM="Thalassiosira sp., Strain NH16" /LENGTH=337 /DNA_ID=CAMNT_0023168963 /DNA_START=246 /DNA_END=1259 /DNA_ORIENTATION=+
MILLLRSLLLLSILVAPASVAFSVAAATESEERRNEGIQRQQHTDRRSDIKVAPSDERSQEKRSGKGQARMVYVQSCPDTLEQSIEMDERSTLHYAIVPSKPPGTNNGLLCARLVSKNEGWIAFAVSANGAMIGSEAIIGVPEDETVLKYTMEGKWRAGVFPMDDDKQTLRDTSMEYNDDDGMMTIEFTKLLVEDGEIPILEDGTNEFLHARGMWSFGPHHYGSLSFLKNFAEDEYDFQPSDAKPITSVPTKSPSAEVTSSGPITAPNKEPISNSNLTLSNDPTKTPTSYGTGELPGIDPSILGSPTPNDTPQLNGARKIQLTFGLIFFSWAFLALF